MDDSLESKTPYCPRHGVRLDELYVTPQGYYGDSVRPDRVLAGYRCPDGAGHTLNLSEQPDWA
jgi:hypothetical protein